MPEREPVVFEFGPFQLDNSQRLLFRDGEVIPVSPKAIETLISLVRNHGRLVEKEELIRQVWPGSVVEESNLAIQISHLRKILSQAMGADPIATIPKRGYRFVAPVTRVSVIKAAHYATPVGNSLAEPVPGEPTPAAPIPVERIPAEPAIVEAGTAAGPATSISTRLLVWTVALAIMTLLILTAFLGVTRLRTHPAPAAAVRTAAPVARPTTMLTDRDSVLLADIQNETGEAVFDRTLRQALTIQLEQSPFLALVSDQQIQHALLMMRQSKTARLSPELAWEVCQRTGTAAVIYGSIATLGNQYILGFRAVNCRTGDSMASQQITAEGKDHVLKAVDDAATALRNKLGESLAQVEAYHTPIEQATTPSLSALQAYSVGWLMNYWKGDSASAVSFFRRAIELDPGFAMAYAALGQTYSNLYEPGRAAQHLKRAYELRERVSEREKFYIESRYERIVTGNLEKARLINQQWAQVYPRDALPHASLGLIDRYLGQYERGLTEAAEALRLAPDSAQSYPNLAFGYILLNRLAEAKALDAEAQAKNLDSPLLRLNLYFLAYLQKDQAAALQLEAWSAGRTGVEDRFLADRSSQYAYSGQLTKALELSQRAIASALRSGAKETAAGYENNWAVFEALIGNAAEARRYAAVALRLAEERDSKYGSALAFALAGDKARARQLADSLEKDFPEDTAVQFCFLPTLRAALVLPGDAAQALEILKAATPYELGKVTNLYPVYLRGEAFLATRQPSEAAAEFQKIIGLPGVVTDDPVGAVAHLQLARAYAMQGSVDKARAAYRDFLALWQEASPTIPVLAAARSELGKLQ